MTETRTLNLSSSDTTKFKHFPARFRGAAFEIGLPYLLLFVIICKRLWPTYKYEGLFCPILTWSITLNTPSPTKFVKNITWYRQKKITKIEGLATNRWPSLLLLSKSGIPEPPCSPLLLTTSNQLVYNSLNRAYLQPCLLSLGLLNLVCRGVPLRYFCDVKFLDVIIYYLYLLHWCRKQSRQFWRIKINKEWASRDDMYR